MLLLDLPKPTVIEEIDYETIVNRKVERVKTILAERGIEWQPSESDDLKTMIEADAYDEMLLRARINYAVEQQLLAFATGSNLDHIAATRYGEVRLEGAKPYAKFEFSLSAVLETDVILSEGLLLGDGKGAQAKLIENVTIPASSLSAQGTVELQEFVRESDVKTEIILTPLPYVIEAKQLESFANGADPEDDERFRERVWLSREKKTTAGSRLQYIYYAKSADVRVRDVQIIDDTAGVVKVYLLSDTGAADTVMIDRVNETLNKEEIRPLTDDVQVYSAEIIDVTVDAIVKLYDLSLQLQVDEQIRSAFAANTMIFGKSLTLAKIYDLLGGEQVADVVLNAPTASVILQPYQVARVTLNLVYEAV